MKVQKIIIKNIGKIAESVIEFNKSLILLFGDPREGKSTHLSAVRWVCGGPWPEDIIRHGEKEGSIEMQFVGGMVSRSWYRSKEGETKARAITAIRNGRPLSTADLKKLLNPFQWDQDYMRKMNDIDRKRLLLELFEVNTADLDIEATRNATAASALRSKLGGYGEIDLTPAKSVDVSALKTQLESIRQEHGRAVARVDGNNDTIRATNAERQRKSDTRIAIAREIDELSKRLARLTGELETADSWLADHPATELLPKPESPDTFNLETQIQNGAAANERAAQFAKNQARAAAKKVDETALADLEKRGREIKASKLSALKTASDSCGIPELIFDDAGDFTFRGTSSAMLSDSELMDLSSLLSAKYPEGFGLELIDRGESLGKTIYGFIDRAKLENKTILATIVGERPATVPDDVGVFVVENGKLTSQPAALSPESEDK